jgi:hypothetical protein
MISREDGRWAKMTGGYKTLLDPRPLLKKLEAGCDTREVWRELWGRCITKVMLARHHMHQFRLS